MYNEYVTRLFVGKRAVWTFLALVVLLLLGGLSIHLFHHPRLASDIVAVRCQWLDFHDGTMPTSESADPVVIARVSNELSKGRFIIPLAKARGIVAITLRDKMGNEQSWTLDVGNEIGEWGTSQKYSVDPILEKILRETMPPPASTRDATRIALNPWAG